MRTIMIAMAGEKGIGCLQPVNEPRLHQAVENPINGYRGDLTSALRQTMHDVIGSERFVTGRQFPQNGFTQGRESSASCLKRFARAFDRSGNAGVMIVARVRECSFRHGDLTFRDYLMPDRSVG